MNTGQLTQTALFCLLSAGSMVLAANDAQAQGETEGGRSMGLASSYIANASGNSALYHNPAGIATSMMYSLEGSYLYSPEMNTFNASVVDSKLNPKVAGGASYSYEDSTDKDIDIKGHDVRVALGSQLIPNRLVAGISGRYLDYTDGDDDLFSGFTGDIGSVLRLTEGLFLGVSANNVIDVCEKNDPKCPEKVAPRTIGGGISFGTPLGLQLSGDARADLSDTDDVNMIYASGFELFAANLVALRTGYQYRQGPDEHIAAGGLGIKAQEVGLDVGYQYNFGLKESRAVIALQLFMM